MTFDRSFTNIAEPVLVFRGLYCPSFEYLLKRALLEIRANDQGWLNPFPPIVSSLATPQQHIITSPDTFFFCRIHIADRWQDYAIESKRKNCEDMRSDLRWWCHNSTVIEDVTGGLGVTAHTVFIISQSNSVEVCVKPAVSRAQAVKLDPCFARHVASWWRISETRDICFQRIWYWRGVVLVSEVLLERS